MMQANHPHTQRNAVLRRTRLQLLSDVTNVQIRSLNTAHAVGPTPSPKRPTAFCHVIPFFVVRRLPESWRLDYLSLNYTTYQTVGYSWSQRMCYTVLRAT